LYSDSETGRDDQEEEKNERAGSAESGDGVAEVWLLGE
jgi:hypothetical protein